MWFEKLHYTERISMLFKSGSMFYWVYCCLLAHTSMISCWLSPCYSCNYAHACNIVHSLSTFSLLLTVFTKKNVTSCFPAVPITFVQQLKNIQAEEGSNVTLRCELSKPGIPVEWRKYRCCRAFPTRSLMLWVHVRSLEMIMPHKRMCTGTFALCDWAAPPEEINYNK